MRREDEDEVGGSQTDTLEAFGLGVWAGPFTRLRKKYSSPSLPPAYDCPIFPGVYDYVCAIAGASLVAAEAILKGDTDIAINWYGGWHHARKLVRLTLGK